MSEQKDLERAAFEADLIARWKDQHPVAFSVPEDAQSHLTGMMLARRDDGEYDNLLPREAWAAWQARANLLVGVPDGYMPIPTAEQLADALDVVRCYHDMSAELIAPELLANLLAAPTVKPSFSDDPRKPHELSAAGCRCVRFGEGNPHWPCPIHAAPTVKAEQVQCSTCNDTGQIQGTDCGRCAPSLPAAGSADLTAVRCQCCATEYQHDSYDAGFIAGSGMCQVCDAAMPPKDLPAAGSEKELFEAFWARRHGKEPVRYPGGQCVSDSALWAEIAWNERDALSAQQSAPERVSVPVEVAIALLDDGKRTETWAAQDELRALLARHGRGDA